jgi:hypothetical protein
MNFLPPPPYKDIIYSGTVLNSVLPPITNWKNQQNFFNSDDTRKYVTSSSDRAFKGLREHLTDNDAYYFDVKQQYPYFDNKVITYDDLMKDKRSNVTGNLMILTYMNNIVGYKSPGHIDWYGLQNWTLWGGFRKKSKKTKTRRIKKKKSRRSR